MSLTWNADDWDNAASESGVVHDGVGDNPTGIKLGYPRSVGPDTLLYLPLDDDSGPFTDYSGNGYDGTNNGTTPAASTFLNNDRPYFDGVDDYISTPADLAGTFYNVDAMTVWFWVQFEDVGSQQRIIEESDGADSWGVQFNPVDGSGAGGIRYYIVDNGGTEHVAETGSATINAGTPYLFVGAWDGDYVYVFLNETLEDSTAGAGDIRDNSGTVHIGRSQFFSGLYFNGYLSEIHLVKASVNSTDVSNYYQAATSGTLTTAKKML